MAINLVFWGNSVFALPHSIHKSVPYTPPPEAGTPQPTGGTGSRGGCVNNPDRPPLVGLVGQAHLMLTTRDRPVFWIYVPYSPDMASTGVFSLQQGDNAIYEGEFSLVSTPGVVGIRLPETAPELEVNQNYDWFIDIHCVSAIENNLTPNSASESLDGLVRRVDIPDGLASDLTVAQTGLERVAAYGRHHIWYDWITEFARLRLGPDASAKLDMLWMDVLSDEQAVLLAPWANEPLVGEITTTVLPNTPL